MDVNAPELDWLVSVDDHVIEPPNVWVDRAAGQVPRRRAPRMVDDDAWVYDGKTVATSGLSVDDRASARRSSRRTRCPTREMRRGRYDPVARLADMDRAGILGSLCFPSFPRFCGQVFWEAKDKDLALLCVQAYNDWMIDEWCGAAPGRYIPLMIIPLWDPTAAAVEMERCAAKGATAFAFSENPEPLGLPTIHDPDRYWDPVMAAAQDLQMVVSHARRLVVDACRRSRRTRRGSPTSRSARSAPRARCWRGCSATYFERMPGAQDRAVRGQHRLDAVLHRAGRAGHRQAAALGEEHQRRVLRERRRDRAGRWPTSTTSTCAPRSATTSSAASSRSRRVCARSTSSVRTT